LSSCKTENNLDKESITKKIESLTSTDKKKAFLENIFFEYQMILSDKERTIKQYGNDSPEFAKSQKSKAEKDDYFLTAIATYFEKYGYPSRSALGQYASIVPLIVHFYASDNKGFKKEHFKYFYGAFKFNDIPKEYFLAYLNGYYQFNEGDTFVKNKQMSVSEEIYAIMDAMNIDY
jgi:hypothetical protein